MKLITLFLALLLATPCAAQSVKQSGFVTPGHAVCWTTNGVAQDCGNAAIPFLTSIGVVAQGAGICQNSGPPTGPYNSLCFSVTNTGGNIAFTNVGGATGGINITLNGTAVMSQTIAFGAKTLATGSISSATCTAAQTASATGVLTTDVIFASFSADPTAVTGYIPLTTGMLIIMVYPTADTVNFKVCNNTDSSITPGAVTINWRVIR